MKVNTMTTRFRPPIIPAAFFGIVLCLAGLGNAWRAAHQIWQTRAFVGEALMALAAVVWALLLLLFIVAAPEQQIANSKERALRHP